MNKALLVIDMQNVCVGENHASFFKYNNKELISKINSRIEVYDSNNVIYVLNIMKKNLINLLAPFKAYEGSEEVEIVSTLNVVNDLIVKKYVGNAFSNPKLNEILKERNIDAIELVGVDGGGCVALTALGGLKEGYKVTINKNLVGTMYKRQANKHKKKMDKLGINWIK